MRKIALQEYAQLHKISRQTVYNQIKEGKLQTEKEGKKTFILVKEDKSENVKAESAEAGAGSTVGNSNEERLLNQTIKHLQEQNEALLQDKDYLQKQLSEANQRAKEANVLHLQAQKQIDKLTDIVGEKDGKIKLLEAKPQSFFSKIKALVGGN